MMARSKAPVFARENILTLIGVAIVPIAAFVIGGIRDSFQAANSLATKTEVADAIKGLKEYTDEKAKSVTDDAHAYSDANRQKTLIELMPAITEIRTSVADEKNQMSALVHAVQSMRDQPWDEREDTRRKRGHGY